MPLKGSTHVTGLSTGTHASCISSLPHPLLLDQLNFLSAHASIVLQLAQRKKAILGYVHSH